MKKPLLKNKFIVGITGGIACGKTTVTNMFANKGIEVVDADVIAREVVAIGSAGLQSLIAHFGNEILLSNGALNRQALREIVFSNEEHKLAINSILHPLIRQEMLAQLSNTKSKYCMLSAALLFENKLESLVMRCAVVDISEEQQLQRTLGRDGGNENTIKGIIKAQISRKKRLQLADDIIDNSGDLPFLTTQVDKLHLKYVKLVDLQKSTQ